MLWMLIDSGTPVDEVIFFDTGMEFDAIYRERDRMLPVLAEHGIRYTELRPKNPMWWNMLCRPVMEWVYIGAIAVTLLLIAVCTADWRP